MTVSKSPQDEISTYPGEYRQDQLKFNKLIKELARPHKGARKPDYNISETEEYYKIELAAPGLQREDFFVNITEFGLLSISALHNNPEAKNEQYKKHTFNYECFHLELLLPENVDTDFITTEYRKGILSIWFLKTPTTYKKRALRVAVY